MGLQRLNFVGIEVGVTMLVAMRSTSKNEARYVRDGVF
jgi:hypothetical protein